MTVDKRPTWVVIKGAFLGEKAKAYTLSEARSVIKKRFGLPRLPVGVKFEKEEGGPVGPSEAVK